MKSTVVTIVDKPYVVCILGPFSKQFEHYIRDI